MGTITKGILGGFSGKVGTVVGGSWKGIDYMRSKSNRKRQQEPTPSQHAQQIKFALCMRFLQPMSALLATSFRHYAVKKTGINSALSYTLKNAIVGSYPVYSISYADVLVSRGDLPNVLAPLATMGAGSVLTISWTDNSGVGIAKASDLAILVAYCPGLNQVIYTTGSAGRDALTDSLALAAFAGRPVHSYIGFITADGRNVASSIYTGEWVVS